MVLGRVGFGDDVDAGGGVGGGGHGTRSVQSGEIPWFSKVSEIRLTSSILPGRDAATTYTPTAKRPCGALLRLSIMKRMRLTLTHERHGALHLGNNPYGMTVLCIKSEVADSHSAVS